MATTKKNRLEKLQSLQANIQECRQKADRINDLIAERRSVIAAVATTSEDLEKAYRHRDDLRARLALGEHVENELQELSDKISDMKSKADENKGVGNDAQYTIQGLQRSLADEQEKIAALQGDFKRCVTQVLSNELDCLLDKYSKDAPKLVELFKRIFVLNDIMVSHFHASTVVGFSHEDMSLPTCSRDLKKDELFSFYKSNLRGTSYEVGKQDDSPYEVTLGIVEEMKHLGVIKRIRPGLYEFPEQ